MSNTDVAVIEPTNSAYRGLEPFSSITGDDLDARFELASAVLGATDLSAQIGVPFNLAHIVRQPVWLRNEKTQELEELYRTTLVTDKGEAFSSTSKGITISVDNILATLGNPGEWGGRSFAFIAEKVGSGNTAYYTLRPVKAAAKK